MVIATLAYRISAPAVRAPVLGAVGGVFPLDAAFHWGLSGEFPVGAPLAPSPQPFASSALFRPADAATTDPGDSSATVTDRGGMLGEAVTQVDEPFDFPPPPAAPVVMAVRSKTKAELRQMRSHKVGSEIVGANRAAIDRLFELHKEKGREVGIRLLFNAEGRIVAEEGMGERVIGLPLPRHADTLALVIAPYQRMSGEPTKAEIHVMSLSQGGMERLDVAIDDCIDHISSRWRDAWNRGVVARYDWDAEERSDISATRIERQLTAGFPRRVRFYLDEEGKLQQVTVAHNESWEASAPNRAIVEGLLTRENIALFENANIHRQRKAWDSMTDVVHAHFNPAWDYRRDHRYALEFAATPEEIIAAREKYPFRKYGLLARRIFEAAVAQSEHGLHLYSQTLILGERICGDHAIIDEIPNARGSLGSITLGFEKCRECAPQLLSEVKVVGIYIHKDDAELQKAIGDIVSAVNKRIEDYHASHHPAPPPKPARRPPSPPKALRKRPDERLIDRDAVRVDEVRRAVPVARGEVPFEQRFGHTQMEPAGLVEQARAQGQQLAVIGDAPKTAPTRPGMLMQLGRFGRFLLSPLGLGRPKPKKPTPEALCWKPSETLARHLHWDERGAFYVFGLRGEREFTFLRDHFRPDMARGDYVDSKVAASVGTIAKKNHFKIVRREVEGESSYFLEASMDHQIFINGHPIIDEAENVLNPGDIITFAGFQFGFSGE